MREIVESREKPSHWCDCDFDVLIANFEGNSHVSETTKGEMQALFEAESG